MAVDARVVLDRDRHAARLVAVGVGGEDLRVVVDGEALALRKEAAAQRVRGADPPCQVGLDAVGDVAPHDVGGDAVVGEIACRIRRVVDVGDPVEDRELVVDVGRHRVLIAEDDEVVALTLARIEIRGIGHWRSVERERRRLARNVGDLEAVVRRPEQQADATLRVEQVRQVAERLALMRLVVDRGALGRRVLDADLVAEVRAGEVVAEGTRRAEQLEARLDVAVAADGERRAAAVLETRVARLDVDDRGRAVAVLRG